MSDKEISNGLSHENLLQEIRRRITEQHQEDALEARGFHRELSQFSVAPQQRSPCDISSTRILSLLRSLSDQQQRPISQDPSPPASVFHPLLSDPLLRCHPSVLDELARNLLQKSNSAYLSRTLLEGLTPQNALAKSQWLSLLGSSHLDSLRHSTRASTSLPWASASVGYQRLMNPSRPSPSLWSTSNGLSEIPGLTHRQLEGLTDSGTSIASQLRDLSGTSYHSPPLGSKPVARSGLSEYPRDGDKNDDHHYSLRIQINKIQGNFPVKLFHIVHEAEANGMQHIISFNPEGTHFRIHQPRVFLETISPRYFRHSRMASFKRQLSMYSFVRLSHGPMEGWYYHRYFQRDKKELVTKISRVTTANEMPDVALVETTPVAHESHNNSDGIDLSSKT